MDRSSLTSLLGVSGSPTTGELRTARRFVARRLHPDATGDRSAELMADVNASCDRWIAEIRSRATPTPKDLEQSRPRGPEPTQPANSPFPIVFRMSYAVGTVLVAFLTMALIVMIAGTSVTAVAVGALFGSMAGAAYLTLVCVIVRRE